jgi:hypothetical protein
MTTRRAAVRDFQRIALPHRPRAAGITYVVVMIYLVLFAVLALGFYASSTTSTQVTKNEVHVERAQLAAQSGLSFFRYHLGHVNIPGGTTQAALLSTAASQLGTRLNGTANMGSDTVGSSTSAIAIPNVASHYISYDSEGSGFRGNITRSDSDLVVNITGRAAGGATTASGRGVQLRFRATPNDTSIFGYGMVTNGALSLSGGILRGVPDASRGSYFSGNLTSSHPLTMSGSAVVSGQVYFSNASGTVSGSGSISGTTNSSQWPQYIHTGTPAPEFPTVDTTPYLNYLNSVTATVITGSTSATPLSNIRIKAGTNPSFSGGGTINGLIYIEAPNRVTFSGGTHITGVIVVDNPNETTSTNSITFSGGGTLLGPENLPSSYGDLRDMTGASILAPNFAVNLTGGSASFGGSILAKSVGLSGGSGGSVNGAVITYGTASTTFSGGSGFTFTNTGPAAVPTTGLSFSGHFAPVPTSYTELVP